MEYEELYRLEPWGAWRDNWHSAMTAQIFASAFRSSKSQPPKIQDFMYKDPQTAVEQADAEMLANLRVLKDSGRSRKICRKP